MVRKLFNTEEPQDQNPFALSTGDMMSALMFIFVLLLSALMLNERQQMDEEKKLTDEYYRIKEQLRKDLLKEFEKDLPEWNAVFDTTKMSIRFQEPTMLFDFKSSKLKPKFSEILNDFFPRYLDVITDDRYKDNIEEIRIEGHTDSQGGYEYNMELSQDRTRAVLNHCLGIIPARMVLQDTTLEQWTKARIMANGLSYSHLILNPDGSENPELSRRVEFRIRTNAEKQLEKIAEKRK